MMEVGGGWWRKDNRKCRTTTGSLTYADRAAVRLERHAHQREAEAGAVVLRREVRLEYALAHVGGDARTVVRDRDRETGAVARHGHVDRAASLHRLGGIAIEVGEGAPQGLVVA